MIKSSTRTMYGMKIQMATLTGRPYVILPNTTLNEVFNQPNMKLSEYPIIKYFAIGVGGSDLITGNSGFNRNKHTAIDYKLHNQIPFVMRTLDKDLSPNEQLNYRFRIIEIIDGIE